LRRDESESHILIDRPRQRTRMADPELLARLDRIAFLLVALVGIEFLKLLDIDLLVLMLVGIAVFVFGFAYLWGRSVFGLLTGEGV